MPNTAKTYVSEKVVAEIVGWGIQTLRNHRFLGRGIPYIKVGRTVRYDLAEVYQFLEKGRIQTENL